MHAIKESAFLSLASSVNPKLRKDYEVRIRHGRESWKQAAHLLIHRVVNVAPEKAAQVLFDTELTTPNMPYLGSGWHSSVFRYSEDTVLKINQKSALLSPSQQESYAQKKHTEYMAMANYLGDLTVPQHTMVAPHPYFKNLTAVQIVQPFHTIKDAAIFNGRSIQPDIEALEQIQAHHPEAWNQLPNFIHRSFELYDDHSLIPDTCGFGNMVLRQAGEASALTIIDGQPIANDNLPIQTIALRQIEALGQRVA